MGLVGATLAAFVLATVIVVGALRWLAPPGSAFMALDALGVIGDRTTVAHRWTPWEAISPHVALAVIAAEDQRFLSHRGFDLDAIADAIERYQAGGRLRGASTISQQVAKNLFLWPGRSYVRKGLEAYLTVLIEALLPKRRILEIHLNVAELGPGVYGVGAASRRFFGKRPDALGADEAALLAAVLPSPRRLRADAPSAYVRERQRWIRRQMRQLGGVAYLEKAFGK